MADRILALDISKSDISKSDSFKAMLQDLGFNALSIDDKLCDIAKTAMKPVLREEPGKTLLEKAKAAAMMIVAYGEDSQDKVVADAKRGIEEYNTFLRQALVGYQAAAINDEFNKEELNPAKALFKGWVQRYDLPDLTVQSKYGKGKFEDVAMNMFDMRIANAKQQIATTGKSEPLINGEFIEEFLTFLKTDVIRALIARYQTEKFNAYFGDIVNDPKNAIAYQYPDVKDPFAETISSIVKLNVEGIAKVVGVAIKHAEEVAGKLTLTVEDFSRFRKLVDEAYKAERLNIDKNIENYNSFARSRVEVITLMNRDDVSGGSAVDAYLKDALKEYFNLKNDITSAPLQAKGVAEAYLRLKELLGERIGEYVNELQGLVTNPLRPGETYEKILKNDLPGEKDLRATFKDMAKDVVQGLSKTSYKIIGDNQDYNFWKALATMGSDLQKAEKKSAGK